MKDTNLAYIAGLFDGEGTVTLSRLHKNDRFRAPVVSVSSTSLSLLEYLKKHYGGYISTHKTYQSHHKPSFSWKLQRNSALAFLTSIKPYVQEEEKQRRIDLILEKYKKCTPRNGYYTDDLLRAKQEFEAAFFHSKEKPKTSPKN